MHLIDTLGPELPQALLAAENREFTPPPLYDTLTKLPTLWVRETFFVSTEQPYALQLHEARGRTLFEIFYPVGKGTERPEALRKLIADAFEKKYGLTNQADTAVHLDKVVRHDGRKFDELWYVAPVSVYWTTYSVATVNRTT